MNVAELEQQLRSEGFRHTYVWQDGQHTSYAEHTHSVETAHIVMDGELTLIMNGRQVTYGPGERCDVPAGAVHAAKMGAAGCRYLVGEK